MTRKRAAEGRRRRIDPTILASLIGAAATLIGAFAGILLGNKGVFVNILPGNPTKFVTVSPSPVPTHTITITANPSVQPPGIYHQGRLVLANDTSADLDAPPSDSQWGEIKLTPGHSHDIQGSGNTLIVLYHGAQGVQLNQATGSSCTSATGYSDNIIGNDSPLTIGQLICIRTIEGRFSLLKIIGLPDNQIVMDVTTYAKVST